MCMHVLAMAASLSRVWVIVNLNMFLTLKSRNDQLNVEKPTIIFYKYFVGLVGCSGATVPPTLSAHASKRSFPKEIIIICILRG